LDARDAEQAAVDLLQFWDNAGMITRSEVDGHIGLSFRHPEFQEYSTATVLAVAPQNSVESAKWTSKVWMCRFGV
jgi:hypothetical protein